MSAPTIGTLSVDTDLTVDIPIDDMGGSAFVRVDYAVPPGSGSTEPAVDSHLWRTLETIETEATVATPAQVYGTTVWVRASGRTSAGERVSPYATASIAIDDVPRLNAMSVTITNDGTVSVTWTAADTADAVRISWAVHTAGESPGTLADFEDLEASVGVFSVPDPVDVGQAITVEVEAWEAWDSSHQVVAGEQGLAVTITEARTVPAAVPLVIRLLETYEHTLEAVDAGVWIRLSDPSAAVLIVPEDDTVLFATGTRIWVEQADSGPIEIQPEATLPTLQSLDGKLRTAGQFAVVELVKVASNTWTIHLDLAS